MKTKTILITLIGLLTFSALFFQACQKEDVSNNSPTCEITAPSDGEECKQGETIIISVVAVDSDGNITEVKFYVDGVSKSSVNNPPYNYDWNTSDESIGNHTLKATSFDNAGASTTNEVTVEVIKGGSSGFTANPTSGIAPLTVNFTDQSTNSPTSWQWDFGDGNNSTEQSPSHTYNDMGQYDVTLTSTNQSGFETETKTNFILVKGTFTDTRDNQTYSIVTIGDQTWFAENLNYETTNSWWYDNSSANGDVYGRLYLWEDVNNACPTGWHTSSDDDWKSLEMYLGMSQSEADESELRGTDEGKKLKSKNGWPQGDIGVDEVGINAVPGGLYNPNGNFYYLNSYTAWWTSNEYASEVAWYRFLESGGDQVGRAWYRKYYGFSIRCVKD